MTDLPCQKDWTVTGVREGKTEDNPHGGSLQKFWVDVEGLNDDVYWRRKEGNKPEIGQSYFGTVSEGQYGNIFKSEQRPDGVPRPASSPAPKTTTYGGAKSNDQQSAIQRQVALKIVAPKINSEGLTDNVKTLVRSIEAFINEASGDPHAADLTQAKVETELDATPVPANDDSAIPF